MAKTKKEFAGVCIIVLCCYELMRPESGGGQSDWLSHERLDGG